MAAEACPSILWTLLTVAPLATAREAAVCRRSCGVTSLSPAVRTAGSNTARRQFRSRSTVPLAVVISRSSPCLPSQWRASDSASVAGRGTVRC
ncbi:hypothetical protein A6V29_18550 [Blastococcus sp. CCUG 61487]|nr:hypothetical protein A6V29_18550 [Blastococcus sp. CCUG 61487]